MADVGVSGFEPDEFAWLRDLTRGPDLQDWLSTQRRAYDEAQPQWRRHQQELHNAAVQLMPPASSTPGWTVAQRTFWWRWEPAAQYPVLWLREEGTDRQVLDLAGLTDTGFVRIGDHAVSPDGRWLAFTLDTRGDEVYDLRLLSLDEHDGQDVVLADRAYYGLLWTQDSAGLLSVVHDAADRPYQVHWYDVPLGTSTVVFTESDERFHLALRPSGLPGYAVLRAASRLTAEEWLLPVGQHHPSAPVPTRGRVEGVDYTVEPVVLEDRELLVQARETGVGYRVTLEARDLVGPPDSPGAAEIVRVLLEPAVLARPRELLGVGHHLLILGRDAGAAALWAWDLRSPAPPVITHAESASTMRLAPYDVPGGSVCLERTSWTRATSWLAWDLATGSTRMVPPQSRTREDLVDEPFPEDLVLETREVMARDGVAIPVTILRARSTPLDGSAPCLLYGYGAWETVIDPEYDPVRLALVRQGVVYAHAHIRGGGELGRQWWRAGRMESKVNTFHDFVDVARALAGEAVHPDRIVAHGLSAGGLLMGAVNALAPTAFAGIIAEAPFVDPVTTMLDETQPLVVVERDEWGDPRREPDLAWMSRWAPYANVPPVGDQPQLLVTSALHDPRVSVWEPARWVARLQDHGSGDRVLFRVDLGARGHWAPPGRWDQVAFRSELLGWARWVMDHAAPDARGERS